MPENLHDKLFKSTFSQIENARGFLKTLLPKEISSQISWDTLSIQSGSFVDAELKEIHSDLLYSVHTGGKEALVYVLVEHKSTQDPWVMFQLLKYQVQIWADWRKKHPLEKHLPPILPLVVYHGERQWRVSKQFVDLFGEQPEWIHPHLPKLECLIEDLTQTSSTQIQHQVGMSALARFVLFLLKKIRYSEDWLEELPQWKQELEQISRLPNAEELLYQTLVYMLLVGKMTTQDKQQLLHFVEAQLGEGMKEKVMTFAEICKNEGREEGEARGKAMTVQNLLKLKFGALSKADQDKVMNATEAKLNRMTELVLTDASLRDILDS